MEGLWLKGVPLGQTIKSNQHIKKLGGRRRGQWKTLSFKVITANNAMANDGGNLELKGFTSLFRVCPAPTRLNTPHRFCLTNTPRPSIPDHPLPYLNLLRRRSFCKGIQTLFKSTFQQQYFNSKQNLITRDRFINWQKSHRRLRDHAWIIVFSSILPLFIHGQGPHPIHVWKYSMD